MHAQLYRALQPRGMFPPTIDLMEPWQIAVSLGKDEKPELDIEAVLNPKPPPVPKGPRKPPRLGRVD